MTNSPTFKLLDLPSLRRASPWDLRQQANNLLMEEESFKAVYFKAVPEVRELRLLADFREDQLFEAGAKMREQVREKTQHEVANFMFSGKLPASFETV